MTFLDEGCLTRRMLDSGPVVLQRHRSKIELLEDGQIGWKNRLRHDAKFYRWRLVARWPIGSGQR